MGAALVTAGREEVARLALEWARGRGMRIVRGAGGGGSGTEEGLAEPKRIVARGARLVAEWTVEDGSEVSTVRLSVRPRRRLTVVSYILMFSGVGLALYGFATPGMSTAAILGFVCALVGSGKAKAGLLSLAAADRSFWEAAGRERRVELLTLTGGELAKGWWALVPCLADVALVALLGALLGAVGCVFALLLAVPWALIWLMQVKAQSELRSEWKLWVLANASRWNLACAGIVGIVMFLMAAENLAVVASENDYRLPANPCLALRLGRYREVRSAGARALEADARARISRLAQAGGGSALPYAAASLGLLCAAILFVHSSGLLRVLKSARLWRQQVGQRDLQEGPYVPPIREAWKESDARESLCS